MKRGPSTDGLTRAEKQLRSEAGGEDAAPPDGVDDRVESDAFLREIAHVAELPPPMPGPGIGERIAHFRILAELGRGGMGVVYLAHDERLLRSVALKVLSTTLTGPDDRGWRFLREARAAAAVSHVNLATIYEVGEVDGRIFIALERIEGKTLRQILASRRLPVDEAVGLAMQMLAGLTRAHQVRVVHRDLKPENVMVTDEGVVKLLDFGLAKRHGARPVDPGSIDQVDTIPLEDTAAPKLLGTPGYMSPEQARCETVDARSDIFSFGIILYEMLAGARAFSGPTRADLLTATLRDAPRPLADHRDDVPGAIVRVVERCLHKDRARRYRDCSSIADDLARSRSVAFARARRASAIGVAGAMAVAAALAVGLGVRASVTARDGDPRLASARAQKVPDPRPTAVTELPLPPSKSPEALAEYAQGMQGVRDGNWGYALEHLERAVTIDPALAAAHLRLAIMRRGTLHMGEARASFGRALIGRGALSERDRALLDAYEPILNRDPPNMTEWQARLRAMTLRYPGDAQIFELLGYALAIHHDLEPALGAARRAVEIDPQYADGWQAVGQSLEELGRTDEALAALDRCLALSPATADCRAERGWVRSSQGRCDDMEEDLRRAVASSQGGVWQDGRAAALFALGRPPEAVLEVLRNKWAQLPEEQRRVTELADRALLDVASGNFQRAESQMSEVGRLIASDSDGLVHSMQASRLIQIYTETNRAKDAAVVADDYLKRRDGWIGSGEFDGMPMVMFWALLRAGAIDRDTFVRSRDAWILGQSNARGWLGGLAPLSIYATGVQTGDEAREALVLFPEESAALADHRAAAMTTASCDRVSPSPAMYGALHVLAGEPREALPFLRTAVSACDALLRPIEHTRASWFLGQALEATGDGAGACLAYDVVLRRWGQARPPSLTAARARGRWNALRCSDASGASDGAPVAIAPKERHS
jgi:eukaryotic-like serine/threonine-protein kinase